MLTPVAIFRWANRFVTAIMVVLFGYVFGSAISVPGGNYREYLMPGLFAMSAFTGVIVTTVVMATDAAKGVMDRFRSMPVARLAVPFGQTGADLLTGTLALVIMVGCGLAVGWRPHASAAGVIAAAGLLILLRYAVSWAGVFIGLRVPNEETADQIVPLIFPITMISNTFVPTSGMPAWLRAISDWNPVSALVAALRYLLGSSAAPGAAGAWPLAHPVMASLMWAALLLALFVPLSVRRYTTAKR